MPSILNRYKDKSKARLTREKCKKANYKKGFQSRQRFCRWTETEIEVILTSFETDREIAVCLGRSVKAIQVKRSREMKGYDK